MLPTVTLGEIAYTNKLGFNPSCGPKLYCTTIQEFQEVLRRVREQAQMYGCKGGQSKDPAYDAEQDVRWAMGDGEPIPLPSFPVDHIANPRPWSWNDSAFNHRRETATNASWTNDDVEDNTYQKPINIFPNPHRPRADSWETDPEMVEFHRVPILMDFFSGEHQTGLDYGQQESDKKAAWSHPDTHSQPVVSPDALTRDGLQETRIRNDATYRHTEPGSVLSDHRAEYQPYVEDIPTTPAKSNKFAGYAGDNNGFHEPMQDKQQLWTSPSRDVTRHEWVPKMRRSRSIDSWDGEGAFSTRLEYTGRIWPGWAVPGPLANTSGTLGADSDALSFDSQGVPYSASHGKDKL